MKTIGDPIFSKDADGKLLSRIGTIFFRTPGLVTKRGVHAMQRLWWIEELNAAREKEGLPPLTEAEENEEFAQSVDLIFTDEHVLIRPDPDRMDLAFRADEELQKTVNKRKIRFLNTHAAKVRNALRARGENWRMARAPISQDDMKRIVEDSRVAIGQKAVYYYNQAVGTRYITAGGYDVISNLPPVEFRAQVGEVVSLLKKRNRMGHPEVDLFPTTTPIEVKNALKALDVDSLGDAELKAAVGKIALDWRMSLPAELREESVENFDWRNAMCAVVTAGPNETNASEEELIQGISPEFYRQIEWLPGARVDRGELIFDPLWDEFNRTRDPDLATLCDFRARNIIFGLVRLFSDVEFVNVGRIARSLARRPIEGSRHGSVYVVQCKTAASEDVRLFMLRFQKWGVAEHLDEGKDLTQAMIEANEYSDYILDRRLMCRQLGMNLPARVGIAQFPETYHGHNEYNGTTVRAFAYARHYVSGTASDKIPPARFRNPAFALAFAWLMGQAAAYDLIVGRRSTETKENLFDKNYEVVQFGDDGLPVRVVVTDHAGSFVNYLHTFEDSVAPYANVVRRREKFVTDVSAFANAYVTAFERTLAEAQAKYRERRRAFDDLFVHRPFDVAGSGAYRWAKTLERLDQCDPKSVAAALRAAIETV